MNEKVTFGFPATGIEVQNSALLLAIDDVSLSLRDKLCLYMSTPKLHSKPMLTPGGEDAPDNLAVNFYGTVLHDGGKFRMWYYPCRRGQNPDYSPEMQAQLKEWSFDLYPGPLCYAESDDGISWTKPNLGQVKFRGNCDNNALNLPDALVSCAAVVKDESDPDPNRRYKMVYQYFFRDESRDDNGVMLPAQIVGTMRTATSADGIKWQAGAHYPIKGFVEHAGLYKYNGMYIVNTHSGPNGLGQGISEGGHPSGRQAWARVSTDFDNWLPEAAPSFFLPEPREPEERGIIKHYAQVHIGIGAAAMGNVLVGLYGIWHERGWSNSYGDLGLLVSNDGLHFREAVPSRVWLDRHDVKSDQRETDEKYPCVLAQGNGILNVGDETRIYFGRWRNASYDTDYRATVHLATLPRDRWGALGLFPNEKSGTVWTTRIVLPQDGCSVLLNAEGASAMQVEIGDERFRLLPEYSQLEAGACDEASGLDCIVRWNADLKKLGGQTVRFKIHLRAEGKTQPRLFAVKLEI